MKASNYEAEWAKFISKNPLHQPKTWQYWRDDIRPKSQFNKKVISRFSKGVKSQQKAKSLIRSGIPDAHRGEVWWACSGGAELMGASKQSYRDYIQLAANTPDNPAAETILKDLHRTVIQKEVTERISLNEDCPNSVSSSTPVDDDPIGPLKNILLAYSVRNPAVGYCQSMNFLSAMLLLHLEEEQAFWVLASLVEVLLLSDYYAPSMLGSRVDQLTFQSCLAWKLPRIFSHLRDLDVILEPILCPWFLCMFLHVISLDAVLRVWDCFFFEGNVILFRIGLAICKLHETEILEAEDIGTLFMLLKKPFDGGELSEELIDTLLTTAFDKSWLGSIPRAALDHFRGEHISTLREYDKEVQAEREARARSTVFNCDKEETETRRCASAKRKSLSIYNGVERSLATVLQSSESFRGKIDDRKMSVPDEVAALTTTDEKDDDENEDTNEDDDEDENGGVGDLLSEKEESVPSIAFKRPPSRRTSVAMKNLLTSDLK